MRWLAGPLATTAGSHSMVVDLGWHEEFSVVKVLSTGLGFHGRHEIPRPVGGGGMTIHVFAGPTIPAHRIHSIAPAVRVHPPARHGDLLRLGCVPRDVVVIVDGVFHQAASIRHKEILALLADRVHVLGASSMGALRAAELSAFGMRPVGAIAHDYIAGVLDSDADVAVAHLGDETHAQVTEAMVNIRRAVSVAVAHATISTSRSRPARRCRAAGS